MSNKNSTIVRFRRLAGRAQLTAVRAIFGLAERFAPKRGGHWAYRMWFTLPKPPPGDRLPKMPEGRRFTVRIPGTAGAANAGTVVGERWGTGPIVYLVHGWGGRRSQLDPFVGPLIEAGFSVVSFDALGHGDSDPDDFLGGKGTNVPRMAEALAAVVVAQGPPFCIIGHSAGAMAASFAMRDGIPVPRAVFIASMAQAIPLSLGFAAQLGFGERVRQAMIDETVRTVGLSWDEFDIPAIADQIATPPTLVIHDELDKETPYDGGVAIARRWPNARLYSTRGLGHRRILRSPEVLAEALTFLLEVRVGP